MTAEVSFDEVTVKAGRKTLLDGVSLHVHRGEMMGVLGPNGAGKTTLLRTLYRAQRPDSGRVLVDGHDVWRMPGKRVARRVAAVLQDAAGDFDLTVFDVVAMGRTPYKRAFAGDDEQDCRIIDEALTAVDLGSSAHDLFGRLSGGQRQRVMIARALAQRTPVIVLDEPTNHLDLRHQHDALRLLRAAGATVLTALHDLNLAAAYCDRICIMNSGRVHAIGAPAEVLSTDMLAKVYGVDARVVVDDVTDEVRVAVQPRTYTS